MRGSSRVGLGSSALSGWDRSVSPAVRPRRGSEPDAPRKPGASRLTGRCEPARLGEENTELGWIGPFLANPGRLFCRGDDPVTRFGVRRDHQTDLSGQASVRARWAARGRGCPGGVTGPCRRATALMGNLGRDRRRRSRATADLPHPFCVHDPVETSRPGGTAPSPVARIMAEPGRGRRVGARNGGEANGRGASGPDLVGRDFTADASNQRRVTDISGFGCVDAKPYPGRDPRPHDRAVAGRSIGQHAGPPPVSSSTRCGHGPGATNPAGDLVVTPTG